MLFADNYKFVYKPFPTMTKSISPKNIVLYADDDPDDLALVREAFSAYASSIELLTFKDGVQVLSYLDKLSPFDPVPCLVILDINMPKLNGVDTLKRLRQMEKLEEVPVVLFTTSSVDKDKAFAAKYKAGFLRKPIDASQMVMITNQFIDYCNDEVKRNIRRYGS